MFEILFQATEQCSDCSTLTLECLHFEVFAVIDSLREEFWIVRKILFWSEVEYSFGMECDYV
jgi:hypothetical protein